MRFTFRYNALFFLGIFFCLNCFTKSQASAPSLSPEEIREMEKALGKVPSDSAQKQDEKSENKTPDLSQEDLKERERAMGKIPSDSTQQSAEKSENKPSDSSQDEQKEREKALGKSSSDPQNKDSEQKKPEQKSKEPEKTSSEREKAEDVKDSSGQEIAGLDTVSVREPEGNWLLKRVWYKKARDKYEKLKEVVSKIIESMSLFYRKRNELEKNVLNPFYTEIGLSNGQILQIVQALEERANEQRQENITLDEKQREVLDKLKVQEQNLKQVEADVNGIKSLDEAIDQDLDSLMQQADRSRKYEDSAWQLFNAIAKELSHKKAREYCNKIDALWQNIKNIEEYINGAFSSHFDSLIEATNTNTKRIKETSDKLKESGFDLAKKYREIIVEKETKKQEKTQEQIDAEAEEIAKKEKELQEQQVGVFGSILNSIKWPFIKAWEWVSSFWS